MRVRTLFSAVLLSSCLAAPCAVAQNGNVGGDNVGGATGATKAIGGDKGVSGAVEQKPLLTPAQRAAIYREVSKDKSKEASKGFAPVVGGDVPPMIALYTLPDDALAAAPEAKLYQYTMVENKVVIVDPTRMRVIDVIGPASQSPAPSQ